MKFENKGLVVLLGVLGIVIIGLVVGIVAVNLRWDNEATVVNEDDKAEELADEYVAYVEDYGIVREKAQELLRQDPVDVDAIIRLYSEHIEYNIASGSYGRASSYMLAEMDDLVAGGFRKEALGVLTSMDFDIFDKPERYRWYSEIIALAEELGDNETVRMYDSLRQEVKEAYEINYASSEAAATENAIDITGNEEEDL